ncbi:MAG: DUF6349 family protein [Propionibacteriaceae bacterium]|nr:DUF6349 family protein [Propionibacteriaceae bacterium]
MLDQDCLFDIDQLQRDEVAATPWHGAPLTYTTDYYSVAELEAAWDRYIAQHGRFGCSPRSHMWHSWPFEGKNLTLPNGHALVCLSADTRCTEDDHDHSRNPLPGKLMYQAICEPCRWHYIGSESEVVLAWHDHAMPGWRDLPVVPVETKNIRAWAEANYPSQWQMHGAPIITTRGEHANRAVPGGSPFGGYDIAEPR